MPPRGRRVCPDASTSTLRCRRQACGMRCRPAGSAVPRAGNVGPPVDPSVTTKVGPVQGGGEGGAGSRGERWGDTLQSMQRERQMMGRRLSGLC